MPARRFVILDRDGTIIVERHYLSDPHGVELIEGVGGALRRLAARDLGLVVVTNQSGIGRGLFDHERLAEIHARLADLLAEEGVRLDGIYYCPHHPDEGCSCRKPRPALVDRAARELGFDARCAFVVGDMASDVALGRAVGAQSILVLTGHGARDAALEHGADYVAADLGDAAKWIDERLAAEPGANSGREITSCGSW